MDLTLKPEQKETQEWARALARELVAPHAEKHARSKIDPALLGKLSEAGCMRLLVPETLGGLGLDTVSFALVIKEISKACASVGVSLAVTNMIAEVIVREGNQYHKEKYLSRLVSGESLTASFCLTENGSGSDAGSLLTQARRSKEGFTIHGEKIYVTNGGYSGFFLVMARSSESPGTRGISAFLVDRDTPGLVVGGEEEKMGLEGSSTVRVSFENATVTSKDLVGLEGDGFKIAMRALDGGRISVSSQALGIAEAALEAGVRYSKERVAFGRPISDFQAIQWKLAESSTALSAAELLVLKAAFLKDQKRDFTKEASQAKVYTTESAVKVCEDMIQILGGYGYTRDYPVERYFRDVRVTTLYEGTSEIQRLVIARELMK